MVPRGRRHRRGRQSGYREVISAVEAAAIFRVAERASQFADVDPGVVIGIELVCTAFVGAFMFTTELTIHDQRGEVARIYDRTPWPNQALVDSPEISD